MDVENSITRDLWLSAPGIFIIVASSFELSVARLRFATQPTIKYCVRVRPRIAADARNFSSRRDFRSEIDAIGSCQRRRLTKGGQARFERPGFIVITRVYRYLGTARKFYSVRVAG